MGKFFSEAYLDQLAINRFLNVAIENPVNLLFVVKRVSTETSCIEAQAHLKE